MKNRTNGILLHPTSLPSKYGIGTLGQAAFDFIEFLFKSGIHVWQILPLGPTGYGNSPYQSFSAYAGNPLLIDLDLLCNQNLLTISELAEHASNFPESSFVDFDKIIALKNPLLRLAFYRFIKTKDSNNSFSTFCTNQSYWLDDYALFMALKQEFKNEPLNTWESDIRSREPKAMEFYSKKLNTEIQYHLFLQYVFFTQWDIVKKMANEKGIKIMGDIPIYVSYDSSDVWTHSKYFELDVDLKPISVAGVPPDYFSETGQLWGNPVYCWEEMKKDNFKFWINRVKFHFELFDMVRIDHFRGFSAYWSIPADEKTAINGKWIDAPGQELFEVINKTLGNLDIIAEDLGVMTPEVEMLRHGLGFPGMKILQFAFDDSEENPYLPHSYLPNCVVYTGTHDNDTTKGWLLTASDNEKQKALDYTNSDGKNPVWDLIRLAWSSVANLAIAPAQDFLELDANYRMNIPGTTENNWKWKLCQNELSEELALKIKKMNILYQRL